MARLRSWVWWTALPFIVAGGIFLYLGFRADPLAKTEDGHSLQLFWYMMGAWFIALTIVVFGGIAYMIGRANRKNAKILAFGLPATATILTCRTTGGEFNNMPQVEMELRVRIPGRPEYGTSHREFVNPKRLPALQEGTEIDVLVDPKDRNKLMIDWRARTP